jgi:MFS family permease
VSVQAILEHGNFGLGTFANLDGEMVAVDGHVYQPRSADMPGDDFNMDDVCFEPTGPSAEKWALSPTPTIGRATTLVMAIACGVAAATVYCNQPMLGIMEAAFPDRESVTGLVPMATQLGFAIGLLLLVPLGDRIKRRRLILLQLTSLASSLTAAALAPDAWTLVVISALVGITSSVAQQIVPFAAELAEPSRRGATVGTVMSGLLCGMLLGRVVAGAVAEHYGWRAMYCLSLLLVTATGVCWRQPCLETMPRRRQATANS